MTIRLHRVTTYVAVRTDKVYNRYRCKRLTYIMRYVCCIKGISKCILQHFHHININDKEKCML